MIELRCITQLWKDKQLDIYFADESGFSLTPYIPYHWGKKGVQSPIFSKKGVVYNVFGLMSPEQKLVSYLTEGSINSQFIIKALDDFSAKLTKFTVVVLDNAPWHRSRWIQAKIKKWEQKGLFLFFLPTYSPHLNKIETLWRFMKYQWIKSRDYINRKTLQDAIKNILRKFGTEYKIDFSMNY